MMMNDGGSVLQSRLRDLDSSPLPYGPVRWQSRMRDTIGRGTTSSYKSRMRDTAEVWLGRNDADDWCWWLMLMYDADVD